MLAKAAQSQAERQAERDNTDDGGGIKNHPVIRTMYDHESVKINSKIPRTFFFYKNNLFSTSSLSY